MTSRATPWGSNRNKELSTIIILGNDLEMVWMMMTYFLHARS